LESAKRLAAGGATILLTGRTNAKGERAVQDVKDSLAARGLAEGSDRIFHLVLDLDDLQNVRSFPKRFQELFGNNTAIDVLVNNAGVGGIPSRKVTMDGFETTFQSNHLGPFLLTFLLFPYLNRTGARVINVASVAHQFAYILDTGEKGLDLTNLQSERKYDKILPYAITKLANILFTQELYRRACSTGIEWLETVSIYPGIADTGIWRYWFFFQWRERKDSGSLICMIPSAITWLIYRELTNVKIAANSIVWLASREQGTVMQNGAYYDEFQEVSALPDYAKDDQAASQLWDLSEKLLSIRFDLEE